MKPLANPLFVKFIIYFNHNQDFFECHEVLEDYWNTFPDRTKEHPLTSYILLSTGMYHWRRGNTMGALRTLKKAKHKMTMIEPTSAFIDGINFNGLLDNVNQAILSIEAGQPFKSFLIEIVCPEIQLLLEKTVASIDLLAFGSDAVIHKHLLRDRTEIIRIRDEKKKGRR